MLRKVRLASAMALAGTLMTALFGLQGSGAAAESMIPTIVLPDPVTEFVSQPVVQPLPQAGSGQTQAPSGASARANVSSLDALVDAQQVSADLASDILDHFLDRQQTALALDQFGANAMAREIFVRFG
jgi:hypothetical protein